MSLTALHASKKAHTETFVTLCVAFVHLSETALKPFINV